MDGLGLGQAIGLAQNLGFDQRINDLQRRQEYEHRTRNEAAARAEMLAQEMQYKHATNPFDENLVKESAKKTINEIGRYRQENQDWEFNPEKRAFINNKIDELRNNPHLLRSLQTKQAYDEYLKDRQEALKNPNSWDMEALDAQGKQFQNYFQSGHPLGAEAAMKEGYQAPVYTRPREIADLSTVLPKIGNSVKDYDIVDIGNGGFYTTPKQGQLEALKKAALAQYGRSIQLTAQRLGLKTPQEVDKWLGDTISSGFDKTHHLGDPYALRKLNIMEANLGINREKLALAKKKAVGSAGYNTWADLTDPNKTHIDINPDVYKDVWGSKPKIIIPGYGGQKADLTGHEFVSDGTIYKPRTGPYKGVPFATGYVDMSIDEAKEKGLIKKSSWFPGDTGDAEDWKPADGYDAKRVSIQNITGKDGKTKPFVRVLHEIPIDPQDQSAKSMYQIRTKTPAKFYDPASNPNRQPPAGAMVDDAGNVFDAEGQFLGSQEDF